VERPQFGFPEAAISQAFLPVIGGTAIPDDLCGALYPLWLYAHWSGD
jgi:hypothetical protein